MQREVNYQKSTLNNIPYTISGFDLSIDLHVGREISNANKDGILLLLAIPNLQVLVNIASWRDL